jgi:hypothetical protein
MPDDIKPVDVTIRPVLPSRPGVTERVEHDLPAAPPRFDIAAQVATPGANSLLPPVPVRPKKEKPVKKTKVKKDPRRSAAAKAIWEKRKAAMSKTPTGSDLATAIVALMKLDQATQDLAMQIARSVVL